MTSGQKGYERYAAFTGGKTFDGRDMPTWSQLPERIQGAWEAACKQDGPEPVGLDWEQDDDGDDVANHPELGFEVVANELGITVHYGCVTFETDTCGMGPRTVAEVAVKHLLAFGEELNRLDKARRDGAT